jgi:putative addiction module component (TIGR02574 family)
VIVERLPEVLALSTEEKEILAEELLNQVVLEQDKDPRLLDLLRRRLNNHNADPESGVRWEMLRERLLKRRLVRHRTDSPWRT